MERNIKTLFQAFMRYGAYFGAIQIVGAILFYLSVNPATVGFGKLISMYFLFSSLPWIGGLLYFGNLYKKNEMEGFISMPEILQFSAFVALFGGVFFVLYTLIFSLYIDHDFGVRLINTLSIKIVSMLEASKSPQTEIDAMILQLNVLKEAAGQSVTVLSAFMAILQYSFNGVITMLIFGWIIRKVRPLFPEGKSLESTENQEG